MKDLRAARSWLFVPGDSERKLAKCWETGADAIIIDLEDSVPAENKALARRNAADAIAGARGRGVGCAILVRSNALETGLAKHDIGETIKAEPDGYVVPKVSNAADVRAFAAIVENAERGSGFHPALLPIATETPEAIFHLHEIAKADPRVCALLWGMEDLGAEIGARRTRRPTGEILDAFKMVRALALFAAAAAGIGCVDTPVVDMANAEGLAEEAMEASWMGFSGKLAIHPGQVAAINAAFSPSEDEIAEARAILEASRNGGGSAFRYKGRMVDTPHLAAATRLLARLDRSAAAQ